MTMSKRRFYFILVLLNFVFFIMFFNIIDVFAIQQQELFFTMEEVIVIASRYPEELWESISSVEVITEEEINTLPSENLAGIIKDIAGLEITDYGSLGDIKAISIRGSSPEQVLVMIDGQVVNDPLTGKIDLGLIPAGIIEKIEIYRGPASALYGANALGGVINIITKSGKGEKKGTAGVYYGSYHTQKYQASYQDQSDNMSYYFTGQYHKTNGDRENSHLDNISFMGKISREINQQSDLDLTIRYCDYKRGIPGPLEYPTPLAQQNDRDFNLNLKWQKREEDRDLNILTWYNFHRLYYDDPEEWGYTVPSIHKAYSSGISFDSTHYNFNLGRENEADNNYTLTWGGELINNIISSTDIGNHQAINGALFVQNTWRPADEDDLKITAGLRYDYNELFGSQFNPRVGMNYRLGEEVSFHASLSRAYRAPTFDDLYWPEDGYVGGNPNLVSETAWAYEAGLCYWNEEGDIQAEFNIFRKNVSQLINWAPDDVGVWRPSNIGSARVDGVEVILKKKFDEHFSGNINYTYLDARDLDTDNQLKPHHKIGFGLNYADQVGNNNDDFTLGIDGCIVSGRPDNLKSYYLFDANISRELTVDEEDNRKVNLNFSIKNLFNQKTELVSGYPIQGRTFLIGISTDF